VTLSRAAYEYQSCERFFIVVILSIGIDFQQKFWGSNAETFSK
jgi:hypothetical protein